ncbi:MAG: hypothetical protein ACOYOQ_04785 [Microthrixaceae bacterium]
MLLAAALGAAFVVRSDALDRRWSALGAVGILFLGSAASVPSTGRLPAALEVLAVCVAALATGVARTRDDKGPGSLPGMAVLFAAQVLWWQTGSAWATVVVAIAAALTAPSVGLSIQGTTTCARAGRAVGRRASELSAIGAAAAAEAAQAAGAWIVRWKVELRTGVIAAAATTPVAWRLSSDPAVVVRGVNDFEQHWQRVEALSLSPFFMSVPHPTFHVSTAIAHLVLSPAGAMTAVMVLTVGAGAAVLVRIGRTSVLGNGPLSAPQSVLFCAVVLLFASPAVLTSVGPAWWQRPDGFEKIGRGAGYLPMHVWGSPTITMAFPMFMALVVAAIALRDRPSSRGRRVLVVVLSLVATLTLPAAMLGLAPALALWAITPAVREGGPMADRRSVTGRLGPAMWLLVPGAAVVLWQIWFLSTSQSLYEETTWQWQPLWAFDYFQLGRPLNWALLAVPISSWWLGGRSYLADRAVRWCGLAVAVAAVPAFLLQETGWKATHGGLLLGFYASLSLLCAFSVRFVMATWNQRRRDNPDARPSAAMLVAGGVLVLCTMAGLVDYLTAAAFGDVR